MAIKKLLYTAHAQATGGRDGRASSDDKALDVELSVPKEMGGQGGDGTNPEQLFAAGYSACFLGALGAVAKKDKTKLPEGSEIKAAVGIGESDDSGFEIQVELTVSLPGLDKEQAYALIEKAHEACPYSNATRGNIDVKFRLAGDS